MASLGAILPSAVVRRRLPSGAGVLLTFDDGPDPAVTPAVLARLRTANALAVFFVVGRRAEAYPDLLRRIRDAGHVIGNHSYSHLGPHRFGLGAYRRDLARCQDAVVRAVGEPPRLFRPPYGRLMPVSVLAPRTIGLRSVTWSLDVRDWACGDVVSAGRAGDELAALVAPRDIVLLHDNTAGVLNVLDRALPALRDRFDLSAGVEAMLRWSGERRAGYPHAGRPAVLAARRG
jgi:peptidoglycan/xylan/chitin deacetylase (PgdA/CDA1 family)